MTDNGDKNPRPVPQIASDPEFDEGVFGRLAGLLPPHRLVLHLAALREGLGELQRFEAPADQLQSLAHAMISTAGSFGFKTLSNLCRNVENELADNGQADQFRVELRNVAGAAQTVIDRLRNGGGR